MYGHQCLRYGGAEEVGDWGRFDFGFVYLEMFESEFSFDQSQESISLGARLDENHFHFRADDFDGDGGKTCTSADIEQGTMNFARPEDLK